MTDFLQQIKENPETPVSMDYFLYSCYELEKMAKSTQEILNGEKRWPLAVGRAQPPQKGSENIFSLLSETLEWYKTQFPELVQQKTLTFAILADAVSASVMIEKDLEFLQERYARSAIPSIRLNDEKTHNEPFWMSIKDCLQEALPNLEPFFLRYLHWCYSEEANGLEIGDRPPVGQFDPYSRRGGGMRGRTGGGRDGGRGGPSRDGGRGGQARDGGRGRGDRGDRGGRGGRDGERGDRGGRGRGDRDRDRGPRRPPGDEKTDAQYQAEALADVDNAIQQLNGDSNLNEVKLKPRNSFYRRIQHQKVNDAGFESTSVGEGAKRTLVVTRAKG
ncbi:MAG: R3H domain-containing nucleic acid-binding protein [Oligoflexales bacterium]